MFCFSCYYNFILLKYLYVIHTQSTIFVLTIIKEQYAHDKQMKKIC